MEDFSSCPESHSWLVKGTPLKVRNVMMIHVLRQSQFHPGKPSSPDVLVRGFLCVDLLPLQCFIVDVDVAVLSGFLGLVC